MRKATTRVFFAFFGALWCALTLMNAAKPPTDFSENESRVLAKFPSFTWSRFLSGDFMREVDTYCNDQFLLRDAWITVQSTAEYVTGKRESNGVYIGEDALAPKLDPPDEKAIALNTEGIQTFAQRHSVPNYLLLVPSAGAACPSLLPPLAHDWGEAEVIAEVYDALPQVKSVEVMETLRQTQRQVYYRTDHHWTTYGAYLGYRQFCATAGLDAAEYEASEVSDSFHGTLYSKSGVRFMKSDVIEAFDTPYDGGCVVQDGQETTVFSSVYFPQYLEKKDQYAFFLGPNEPVVTLHGTAGTGKKLLVFKDSYAHCMAPMLLRHYDTVTLVDLRYIKQPLSQVVTVEDYDAVLHLYSVDVFVHQNSSHKLLEA